MKTLFISLRAFFYVVCFVLFWGWIALGVRRYEAALGGPLPPWTEMFGIFFVAAGTILALSCVGVFVKWGSGTPAPFDAPTEFVARGPYAYVRNPMYIGGWIMLVGFGLHQQSLSILLFSLVWLLLIHLFVLFVEEPGLEERFGQSYLRYKELVNRWMPNLHKFF